MKTLVLATAHWKLHRKENLANLEQVIDKFLGETSTGCFILTLDGPMRSDEVTEWKRQRGIPEEPYWKPLVMSNAKRIQEIMGIPEEDLTYLDESESRVLYMAWCKETDYKEIS